MSERTDTPRSPSPPALTADDVAGVVEKPLRLLPPSWRIPVWRFWAHYSTLIPNQLPLCMRLRDWIESDGLTLGELLLVFSKMTTAEGSAQCRYPGDVLAELARLVAVATYRRKLDEKYRRDHKSLPAASPVKGIAAKIGVLE